MPPESPTYRFPLIKRSAGIEFLILSRAVSSLNIIILLELDSTLSIVGKLCEQGWGFAHHSRIFYIVPAFKYSAYRMGNRLIKLTSLNLILIEST